MRKKDEAFESIRATKNFFAIHQFRLTLRNRKIQAPNPSALNIFNVNRSAQRAYVERARSAGCDCISLPRRSEGGICQSKNKPRNPGRFSGRIITGKFVFIYMP